MSVLVIKGWINNAKNGLKALKLIVSNLASTITSKKEQLLAHEFSAAQSPTEKGMNEYQEASAVVECIIDTLHLLVQASWYVNLVQRA